MSTFDEREQAFEKKFAHDSELQFRVEARSRNLLSLWVAHHLGHTGDAAVDYAKGVLMEWMKPGALGAVDRLMQDVRAAGAALTEEQVRAKYVELLAQAKQQVMKED